MYWTCVLKTRFKWHELIIMAGEYIYQDDSQPTAYNRICSDCIDESLKTYIRIVTMEIMSLVIAAIGPFYTYIIYGTKSTFLCVRLPYLNTDPDLEFMVNISWEMIGMCLGFISFIAVDVAFMNFINTISVTSRLCELRLNEFSDNLEYKRGTEEQIRKQLRIIMMQTKFIDE